MTRLRDSDQRAHAARRYNIVFVIDGLSMGGAERLMVPVLKHLDKATFAPHVCVLQIKDGNPVADDIRALGVPVTWLPVGRLRDVTALPRLIRFLKGVGADLVHTQLEFANVLGSAAAKILRLPGVCTIHTLPPREAGLKTRLHGALERLSLRFFCDRVIAVSEGARRHYLTLGGVPPDRVTTVYNGIDLTDFARVDRRRERAAVRRELGVPEDASLLTTVAVLRPQKGIRFMIRALPGVLRANPSAYYLIAGDGPHRDALAADVDEAGVRERVIFAGMRDDVPRLLAASDVFVLPTLTEALPTVLAEAMAARLPIVASAVGGVPEMVEDGRNGLLVPAGDPAALSRACLALLSAPERREMMAEAGWRVVNRKFNVRRQVGQLEAIYLHHIKAYGK